MTLHKFRKIRKSSLDISAIHGMQGVMENHKRRIMKYFPPPDVVRGTPEKESIFAWDFDQKLKLLPFCLIMMGIIYPKKSEKSFSATE